MPAGADVEVERELSAERLKALVDGGDEEVRRLLGELLRSYGSPCRSRRLRRSSRSW
jgi:hypothetical protein